MRGILSYGAYVPYHRLERQAIGQALGGAGGRGTRAVASYDEDAATMAVAASAAALASGPDNVQPASIHFATASPPYLEKTSANTIHAALGLPHDVLAVDMAGAVRSGAGALLTGLDASSPVLVALADIRTGLPGSTDESQGGDGAAAFLCGDGPGVIAELVGTASTSAEFIDRWRQPGDQAARAWEERFGEYVYVPLARQAIAKALTGAGVSMDQVDHLVATGTHARAIRTILGAAGARREAIAADFSDTVGNTGTAHVGLMLADVLDRAAPNQLIGVLLVADGATFMLFRTTEAIAGHRPAATVQAQIAGGRPGLPYANFLTWRDMLRREPPRRPDPVRPSGPPSFRSEGWKFGFNGSRCKVCGTRHLPPQRVCVHCQATDQMQMERMAEVPATIATFTIDRLAYSPSPPLVAAVLDFDRGGRLQCELTDVDPATIAIGQRVEMTFRKLYTADGIHNYFWKGRPARNGAAKEG